MADLSLKYLLFGEDRTASKSIKGVGKQAQSTAGMVHNGIGKIGSIVGGEIGDMIDRVTAGFDSIGEHQKGMGAKIAAGGVALAGIGAAVQAVGSADAAATGQLGAAIKAQGGDISDYRDEIEKAIKKQETFGHTADDTSLALAALTEATGSPTKALSEMSLVADLAAAKHTSLADASTMVARVLAGRGMRVLGMYGITMDSAKVATSALTSATKNHETALTTLDKARQKLTDLETIDHGKKKLTIGDQIALRNAHDNVTKALAGVKSSTEKMKSAQDLANKATHAADDATGKLAEKLKGQAAAAVDSFTGRLNVMRVKATDAAAQFGQKFGPAITMAGVAVTALGTVVEILRGRQVAAAAATAAMAAAQALETTATGVATGAVIANNVAWYANPITWVIAGIIALVAAVYLIATKTTWFQTVWQYMTSSLAAAWRWLWNSILAPIIRFVLNGFASITDGIANMLSILGNLPNFGWAKVAADKMAGAAAKAHALANGIKDIPRNVPVNVRFTGNFSWLGQQVASALGNVNKLAAMSHRASGGPVTAGTAYLVGENGPEVFVPGSSGGIIPNGGRGSPAGGGSGGASQPLVVQFMLDGRVLHQSLLALKRTTGGGLALG